MLTNALVALVPLIIGMIYYSPALFQKAWISASGVAEERIKSGNMILFFGLVYLLSFILSIMVQYNSVHSMSVAGMLFGPEFGVEPTSELGTQIQAIITGYGDKYNTFKHGAFHGLISSLFLCLPFIGVIAIFERRSFKYVLIHWGFWAISLILMGGLFCQFAE
jgi:hypothetical protein